eukprot:CAMPEP_0178390382 /NCGR_PEP_ID=MMETSP0689_2-20121128/10619_1 /TAXON_ID=160604 /ORGANISM="Amphidinium massartii, Strain CS-259" /LENGTH=583 /DNA_ID=CAMNT_0020010893 /DNA_START=44 /DNA_END=1792 /DNA_ORIENTATION=-
MPALSGRTVQVVNDFSVEEQLYLYERARRLKAVSVKQPASTAPPLYEVQDGEASERIGQHDATVYLIFMESSTRTKESFRNAAAFQGVKVNEFQAETSSFQKNETICDTIKMLSVYSTQRTVFVIRSPLEGVCRWLETALPRHAERYGVPRPSFLNAGDGKFTHPMAEFSDIFSILELSNWCRDSIHLALVGDLSHGRTAHSKVDGLCIFKKVRVDLVAPDEFAYPVEYVNRMKDQGFEVRKFSSVEAYMDTASDSLAKLWYFCRPQMSKLGDLGEARIDDLWGSVSFKQQWQDKLPEGAKFLQTLPRDKDRPQVPLAFDTTSVNAWDSVANNSYYLNIVILGALHGAIGAGLPDRPDKVTPNDDEEEELENLFPLDPHCAHANLPAFLENVSLVGRSTERKPARANTGGSTVPLRDGLVIDHVGLGDTPSDVWRRLRRVRSVIGWGRFLGSEGVYTSTGQKQGKKLKGIMHFPNMNFAEISAMQLKIMASIAPGCTVNAISSSSVVKKLRLHMPEQIHGLPNTSCKNELCVSHPNNKQRDVVTSFVRVKFYETSALPGADASQEFLFVCKYCQWPHQYKDIW